MTTTTATNPIRIAVHPNPYTATKGHLFRYSTSPSNVRAFCGRTGLWEIPSPSEWEDKDPTGLCGTCLSIARACRLCGAELVGSEIDFGTCGHCGRRSERPGQKTGSEPGSSDPDPRESSFERRLEIDRKDGTR